MITPAWSSFSILLLQFGVFCSSTKFQDYLFSYVKNAMDILIGIVLNLQITLGHIVIFTILILLIHEHGISFHLFMLSSNSFISVLQFSVYRSFTSLVKFIPRYFILFDVIISGIVFLISLSNSSLLMYRNATYFCVIILYPATLQNSFTGSNSSLVKSLGFSTYSTCHLQIVTVLLLPFQFGYILFPFFV